MAKHSTASIPVETLKPGDVIMPPEREVRLWMRRHLAVNGLPERALYLTVVSTFEATPDARGRWIGVRCAHAPEWLQGRPSHAFIFKARPATEWPRAMTTCGACGGNGKADGIGDPHDVYGSDNCGACGGSGRVGADVSLERVVVETK